MRKLTPCAHSCLELVFSTRSMVINFRIFSRPRQGLKTADWSRGCDVKKRSYATPKVTKYQRCNFIIQIYQFTIKIDKININLLFECVKIVEFTFNSHVFHVMYQETRFLNQDACFSNQEGRRQFLISFVSEGD